MLHKDYAGGNVEKESFGPDTQRAGRRLPSDHDIAPGESCINCGGFLRFAILLKVDRTIRIELINHAQIKENARNSAVAYFAPG
jgi:hypothetical protein